MAKDLKIAPGAIKTWSLNWAKEGDSYLEDGETITAHDVQVTTGLTLEDDTLTDATVAVKVQANGDLRQGQRASILITIETSAGRQDTRRIPLTCDYGEIE